VLFDIKGADQLSRQQELEAYITKASVVVIDRTIEQVKRGFE